MQSLPMIATACVTILAAGTAMAQVAPQPGVPTMIDGIQTVCTGAGQDSRDNPAWNDYSLKLEFDDANGAYLGDERVTVTGNGHSVSVHCAGPWVLMMLPDGTYHVSADLGDRGKQQANVQVPGRTILSFNMESGESALAAG